MRHGEAISNAKDIMSCWPETFDNPLTKDGVKKVTISAQILLGKKIDMIFSSDVKRAAQTAQIVADLLHMSVHFDERLREIHFGTMNGRPVDEIRSIMGKFEGDGYARFGGEDYKDVSERVYDFFEYLEKTYQGKVIVIVSHQAPLTLLEERVCRIPLLQITKASEYVQIQRAEIRDLGRALPKGELLEMRS